MVFGAQACLCHPAVLGPARAARFILPALLDETQKADAGISTPSFVIAARIVTARRGSVTFLEAVVTPRLLFLVGSLAAECPGPSRRASAEQSVILQAGSGRASGMIPC